ncbi:SGNH/GDSL hydrolase family protein [Pseudobutyrivibrio sp.]|uniref:SGNH/GDSL hydrolase family protein n=1 Tax=Pseudobutyrivibrio sp. TaxID=2014367 RepID=UPI0025F5146D|nr:SGNH/GDSL hydrolase family protein [Pseudobutyrivibrio sp.]
MKKANAKEEITIGFIGGSITQGSLSTSPHNCYAWKVFEWWTGNYEITPFNYVNAGIGGTTSHFAAARIESDLLSKNPDLVFVEFSVNDESDEHFLETYEGLVRHIYQSEKSPAVVLISNVFYDTGANAQLQHSKVARHYELPLISMQSAIYPAVRDGLIVAKDITPDNLHPNDMGHELVASVINYFLDRTLQEVLIGEEPAFVKGGFPEPITANTYEDALRIDNRNYKAFSVGFSEDESIQQDIIDCFKNGWLSGGQKCEITFEVECSGAAIQYRKYVSNNAPIAKVFVDDEKVTELDANFEETWGDKLELTTVMEHRELKNHKIKLVLEDCKNTKNPFNLVSVILAR